MKYSKKMKTTLLLLSFLFLVFISCNDDEDPATPQNPVESFDDGTIILGPDNCGFLLSLPKDILKPVKLDSLYMVNGLPVRGKFRRKSSNAICGLKNLIYQNIVIVEIQFR